MDDIEKFLCDMFEQSTDKQYDIPSCQREWDENKLQTWVTCCFALRFCIANNREILARVLRCCCDADACGGEVDYMNTCQSFCDDPYENSDFVRELIKAAPEMLIKSPDRFGDELFSQFCNPYRSTWSDCLDEFRQLKQKDQQIIINYLSYELQRHSPEGAETEEEDDILQLDRKALQDCLSLSGIKEGDPRYFYEYHWS